MLCVKAAQMVSNGSSFMSQDTASFLQGSINRWSSSKLPHFATYCTMLVYKSPHSPWKPTATVSFPGEGQCVQSALNRRVFFLLFLQSWIHSAYREISTCSTVKWYIRKTETGMQHDDCVLISVMFSGVKGHKINTERQTKCVLLFLIS